MAANDSEIPSITHLRIAPVDGAACRHHHHLPINSINSIN